MLLAAVPFAQGFVASPTSLSFSPSAPQAQPLTVCLSNGSASSATVTLSQGILVNQRRVNRGVNEPQKQNYHRSRDPVRYDHAILKPERIHELIARVRKSGLLTGTSYGGGKIPMENVVRASDFLLVHGNGVKDPLKISEMGRQTRAVPGFRPTPIVFNEDDHFDFDAPDYNMLGAVREGASWGYIDPEGYQSPPVNWGLDTERKRAFFRKLKEMTGQ